MSQNAVDATCSTTATRGDLNDDQADVWPVNEAETVKVIAGKREARNLRKRKKKLQNDFEPLPSLKKGRQDLALREKIKILQILDEDPKVPQRLIAAMYKVSQSQISRIQNSKARLMKEWQTGNLERKRNRRGKGGILEEKLLQWFNEAKEESVPISGPVLMEKAKAIASELGLKFIPTSGWFGRWKNRSGITLKGMKLRKNGSAVSYSKLCNHWRRYTFAKVTKETDSSDVWFVDQTALYYNATESVVDNLNDSLQHLKRITVVLAFNSNGSQQRKPMVIGSESIAKGYVPLTYCQSADGKITPELFFKWLTKWNKELKTLKKRIIIFLKRSALVTDTLPLDCITLHHYPASDSDDNLEIQPFHGDIFRTFKSLFRYQMCSQYMANDILKQKITNSNSPLLKYGSYNNEILSIDIHLTDALHMIKRAWEHVNPDILVKGLVKSGLSKQAHTLSVDGTVPPPLTMSKEQFDSLVDIDEKLENQSVLIGHENSYRHTESADENPLHGDSEALLACHILRTYLQNGESGHIDMLAEIEAAVQNSVLRKYSSLADTRYNVPHPLYSPFSIHSMESRQNSLSRYKGAQTEQFHHQSGLQQEGSHITAHHAISNCVPVPVREYATNFISYPSMADLHTNLIPSSSDLTNQMPNSSVANHIF